MQTVSVAIKEPKTAIASFSGPPTARSECGIAAQSLNQKSSTAQAGPTEAQSLYHTKP